MTQFAITVESKPGSGEPAARRERVRELLDRTQAIEPEVDAHPRTGALRATFRVEAPTSEHATRIAADLFMGAVRRADVGPTGALHRVIAATWQPDG